MLGTLAAGALITGTLLNAYSQASAYQEQKATSKYNQAILESNNRIDQAMIDMDIRRIREEGEELLGSQRAMMGKSGTKFSGSNIAVFMDTIKDIEMDVITLEIEKMAGGARTGQQIDLERMSLASARRALPFNVASTLISGAGKYASMKD